MFSWISKIAVIIKLLRGFKPKATWKEIKELIDTIKEAKKDDGKFDTEEAREILNEAMDVVDYLIPGIKSIFNKAQK